MCRKRVKQVCVCGNMDHMETYQASWGDVIEFPCNCQGPVHRYSHRFPYVEAIAGTTCTARVSEARKRGIIFHRSTEQAMMKARQIPPTIPAEYQPRPLQQPLYTASSQSELSSTTSSAPVEPILSQSPTVGPAYNREPDLTRLLPPLQPHERFDPSAVANQGPSTWRPDPMEYSDPCHRSTPQTYGTHSTYSILTVTSSEASTVATVPPGVRAVDPLTFPLTLPALNYSQQLQNLPYPDAASDVTTATDLTPSIVVTESTLGGDSLLSGTGHSGDFVNLTEDPDEAGPSTGPIRRPRTIDHHGPYYRRQ